MIIEEKYISESWDEILNIPLFKKKMVEVEAKRSALGEKILPKQDKIFNALKLTPFDKVKVLIIGQDPYRDEKDACGLAFSSPSGIPVTLQNIFAKIKDETKSGDLTPWAEQGVLLLNRALTLTIDENDKSEKRTKQLLDENLKFWKQVIDDIIFRLLGRKMPLVVMLWGTPANELIPLEKDVELAEKGIKILRSSHPSNNFNAKSTKIKIVSGTAEAFVDCNHFFECNEFLKAHGLDEINWGT